MDYRYKLDDRPGRRKINCPKPACPDHGRGGAKTFTRYYDTKTGEYIADEVGRCDHEVRCRYHLTPSEYFERYPMLKERPHGSVSLKPAPTAKPGPEPANYPTIPFEVFRKTLKDHHKNNIYLFLRRHFTREVADRIAARYYLGTSKYLPGAPVFWYIDSEFNVTTGKIIYYPDPLSGKRYRESELYRCKPVINFVHAVLKMPGFKRKPCFFGEHLLTAEPEKPVMVVESEKSALIASAFYPESVILATGGINGLQNLNWSLTRVREVTLVPDTSTGNIASQIWTDQAKLINSRHGLSVKISDKLDTIATEKQKNEGWDAGDFLLRQKGDG